MEFSDTCDDSHIDDNISDRDSTTDKEGPPSDKKTIESDGMSDKNSTSCRDLRCSKTDKDIASCSDTCKWEEPSCSDKAAQALAVQIQGLSLRNIGERVRDTWAVRFHYVLVYYVTKTSDHFSTCDCNEFKVWCIVYLSIFSNFLF